MNANIEMKKRARREIRRLRRMIAMGGSSAAIVFEAQIAALKAKYSLWGELGL